MFFCKKCSTQKPETEWYYSVRGRDSMCKSCRKEYRKDIKRGYQKTYYEKNKEYYQNLNKEFFDNNPEYHKKWNRRKPENRLLMSARKRAKEKGLEPLATFLFEQKSNALEKESEKYIDTEKDVKSTEEALSGARDIIAEWISEHTEARASMRELFLNKATVGSKLL
jgi:hypothetical protein